MMVRVTTLRVRTSTLEPPECLERFEGEAVPVRRRVVGKSPPEAELRAAQLDKHCCPRTWAEFEAAGKALLENWGFPCCQESIDAGLPSIP